MQNKPGAVVQLVRISACHAGGRGFEPRHSRHFVFVTFPYLVQKRQIDFDTCQFYKP